MEQEWFPRQFGGIDLERFILKNANEKINPYNPYIKFSYDTPFNNHFIFK